MKKAPNQSKSENSFFWKWGYLILLSIIFLLVYQYTFRSAIDNGGDNAGYYILGKSIKEGLGYADIHLPTAKPANHFPPGYPAILSVFMTISEDITFLKIMNGVLLLGATILSFFVFRTLSGDKRLALAAAIFLLLNFHLLSYSSILMSEIPFLFFAMLAVYLFFKLDSDKPFFKNPSFYGLLVVSSFAFHIRTAGIALIAGIGLAMLLQKKWKLLVSYTVGFGLLATPWFLRGQKLGGSNYIKQLFLINPYRPDEGSMDLSNWVTRFTENLSRYLTIEIPNGIFPFLPANYTEDPSIGQYFWGIIIVGILVFGILKLKSFKPLAIGYLIGTFGILLLWPDVWFGIRFLLPLIPFLIFFFLLAVKEILEMVFQKMGLFKGGINPLGLLAFSLIFIGPLKNLHAKTQERIPPGFENFYATGKWLQGNSPAEAVIANRKPTLLYLHSGRKSIRYPFTNDPNEMFAFFEKNNVTHVVVDQLGYSSTSLYLAPVLNANLERFQLVYQLPNPDTYVFAYNSNVGYSGEWRIEKDQTGNNGPTLLKEGKGTMKYLNGQIYEGDWKNGKRHGFGKLTFPNGNVFEGEWANDLQNGNGKLISITNEIIQQGTWENGSFIQ